MTGRYAIRSGNGTVPLGEGVYGLVQWEVTMAEEKPLALATRSSPGSGRSSGRMVRIMKAF
jgi:hypothetical protein